MPRLTRDQIRQIEAALPPELRILCACAVVTGLRIGELLALRWCDVDLDSRTITVSHTLWRCRLLPPKTEDSKRTIRVSRKLADRLSIHRTESRWSAKDDFVFARVDGIPNDPDFLRVKVLYPAMRAVGIEPVKGQYGFHIFRHSAASILQTELGDVKVTQEFLGHSSVSTTADVYTHLEDEIIEGSAQTLDDVLWPESGPVLSGGSNRIQ